MLYCTTLFTLRAIAKSNQGGIHAKYAQGHSQTRVVFMPKYDVSGWATGPLQKGFVGFGICHISSRTISAYLSAKNDAHKGKRTPVARLGMGASPLFLPARRQLSVRSARRASRDAQYRGRA